MTIDGEGTYIAANQDGVETIGDVDISESALATFVAGSGGRVILRPGFEAAPGVEGRFQAYIESSASELEALRLLARGNDSDGDGMPDWWELVYGLDPFDSIDRNEDLDNDGIDNFDEFAGQTDPFSGSRDMAAALSNPGSYLGDPILIINTEGHHKYVNKGTYTVE